MPFDLPAAPPRRIAIVGGGISGLAAAFHLATQHTVTLLEAEPRLGGHARTVIAGKHGDQPVDTGFIVFNYVNYPNLARLFAELEVPVVPSSMSFGASVDGGRIEYGLKDLRAVVAQPRNLARPGFLGMVRDILRFNAAAARVASDPGIPLGRLLDDMRMGRWFRDYYITPISGAIWSTPKDQIMDFPARALVQFFDNHALLSHTGQHQWWTVAGGSAAYVTRLQRALIARGVTIRTGTPAQAVARDPGEARVRAGGDWERFDDVVFATHSDVTLQLLSDAAPEERAALSAVRYQSNRAVLHSDAAVMPRRRAAWSSWNYTEAPGHVRGPIDMTYWMNSLQPIPADDPLFVTLNSRRPIDPKLIHDETTFRHPVFDLGALAAQATLRDLNGVRNTWFCGAWMRNGFHEDGYASAMDVLRGFARRSEEAAAAA